MIFYIYFNFDIYIVQYFFIFFLDYADIFRLNLEEHRRQIPSSPAATHDEKASLGY